MSNQEREKKHITLDEIIKYREHFRKFHEFEDNLINQRIAFLLTSQSILLIVHFRILLDENLLGKPALKLITLIVLTIFSIFICGYIKAVIEAAFIIKDTIEEQWSNFIGKLETNPQVITINDNKDVLPDLMFHAEIKKHENDNPLHKYWTNLDPIQISNFYNLPKQFQYFWLILIIFDSLIIFQEDLEKIIQNKFSYLNLSWLNLLFPIFIIIIIICLLLYICLDKEYKPPK